MASKTFLQRIKSTVMKLSLIAFFFTLFLTIYLDSKVRNEFDQQAWEIPAKVYARTLSFSLGQSMRASELIDELKMLGYRKSIKAISSGQYERYDNTFIINTRPFKFWDGEQSSETIRQIVTSGRNGLQMQSLMPDCV